MPPRPSKKPPFFWDREQLEKTAMDMSYHALRQFVDECNAGYDMFLADDDPAPKKQRGRRAKKHEQDPWQVPLAHGPGTCSAS